MEDLMHNAEIDGSAYVLWNDGNKENLDDYVLRIFERVSGAGNARTGTIIAAVLMADKQTIIAMNDTRMTYKADTYKEANGTEHGRMFEHSLQTKFHVINDNSAFILFCGALETCKTILREFAAQYTQPEPIKQVANALVKLSIKHTTAVTDATFILGGIDADSLVLYQIDRLGCINGNVGGDNRTRMFCGSGKHAAASSFNAQKLDQSVSFFPGNAVLEPDGTSQQVQNALIKAANNAAVEDMQCGGFVEIHEITLDKNAWKLSVRNNSEKLDDQFLPRLNRGFDGMKYVISPQGEAKKDHNP